MKKVYIDKDGKIYEGLEAEVVEQVEENLKNAGYFEALEEETKGGNIMNRLFKTKYSDRVVEFNKEDSKIKRKAKVIGEVVSMSVKGTLSDPWTYAAGASVGLNQGLKYKGDFKAGGKAGLATVAVVAGVNVIGNIVLNKEVIKEA